MPAGTSYTFQEGMLSQQLTRICLKEEENYTAAEVKNQFLHAVHPIGWIKKLELEVDGQSVPQEDIFFVLRGQWFCADKMFTISEVFWNLSETAQICFREKVKLRSGRHHIKCTFTMSMLEDTQVLDRKGQWPQRVEFVEGEVMLEGGEE